MVMRMWAGLLLTVALAATQTGGCGGGGGGGGSSTAVSPSDTGSATLTYSNGHPLNWDTNDSVTTSFEDQVFTLVNNYRVSLGLNALSHDAPMRRCARGHSRHMRADVHNFFAHVNPEGDSHANRMTTNGIVWTASGENIAAGYTDPNSVFAGWQGSPGHDANMRNPAWTRTGVGYQPGAPLDSFATYWTQLFAD